MTHKYDEAMKGTRNQVIKATKDIVDDMKYYGQLDEGRAHKLKLCVSIMRSISVAAPSAQHYDLYCDIFERFLMPNITPAASAKHWTYFLEYCRYFHYLLIDKKYFAKAVIIFSSLFTHVNDALQSEADYKHLLNICGTQLISQSSSHQKVASTVSEEVLRVLEKMEALFKVMLRCNIELNFQYPELMEEFLQCLMLKRSTTASNFIATLPAKKQNMYDALHTLLAGMCIPQPPTNVVNLRCQQHLEAIATFLNLDVRCKLQTQLALQHVRICREMRLLQNDEVMSYIISLLYYYVKLAYMQTTVSSFQQTYKELCDKFNSLFEKSGAALMEEQWFREVPIMLNILYVHMQYSATTPFTAFWQQMNSVACYVAHFELILGCFKLLPGITVSQISAIPTCCKSSRKHLIVSFAQSAVCAYSAFYAAQGINLEVKNETNAEKELEKKFIQILRHAINVIEVMNCINSTSQDLKVLIARYAQLTTVAQTPSRAHFCLKVAQLFVKIKHKFATSDWTLFLRRIYKTANFTDDSKLIGELQSCYLASMITGNAAFCDYSTLRQHITVYYTSINGKGGNCLLELYECSSSPFKTELTMQQKRLLYWCEMQYVLKYLKAEEALLNSLLRCSHTEYDYVLVARAFNTQKSDVRNRLNDICQTFRKKVFASREATRLEQLTYAHACAIQLYEETDMQKKTFTIESKDCTEDNLEDLLQRKELETLNVACEMGTVRLALEALHAFETFYLKADSECIDSDVALIDWEYILDDLAAIAQYLQFSAYTEYATNAWQLYYRIANMIDDNISALRGLAYFCEHVAHFDNDATFNLQQEVTIKLPSLLHALQNLLTLSRRNQSFVLLCACQVAYYSAHARNFVHAQMLLQLVRLKQETLPERQGKYDVVLATVDAVNFRIEWLRLNFATSDSIEDSTFMEQCLVFDIELALERLRNIVFISSVDAIPYMILLFNFVLQIAECTANRLCDNIVNSFIVCSLKNALQAGAALRTVQLQSMWMWVNLQMENVKKAQTKLKIIEFVLGAKSRQALSQNSNKELATKSAVLLTDPTNELLNVPYNSGFEMVRKVVQVQTSPIPAQKLQLSPNARNYDLQRFFNTQSNAALQQEELLRCTYFVVGCLNARLYYLIGDYEQLDDFYASFQRNMQKLNNPTVQRVFENMQMLCLQHYANYLRAHKKYEKALQCIESALTKSVAMTGNIDAIYQINLKLQLRATTYEQQHQTDSHKTLCRALEFNVSPQGTTKTHGKMTKDVPASARKRIKSALKSAPFAIYDENEVTTTNAIKVLRTPKIKPLPLRAKAHKQHTKSASESESGSGSTTPETPDTIENVLNMCQLIEIVDSPTTTANTKIAENTSKTHKSTARAKSSKTKPSTPERQMLATCITKTSATTIKKRRVCRSSKANQSVDCIDLDDSLTIATIDQPKSKHVLKTPNTATPSENVASAELLEQMRALALNSECKPKTRKKRQLQTEPSIDVVIVDDSPAKPKPKSRVQVKANVGQTPTANKITPSTIEASIKRRGRPRKVIDADENLKPENAFANARRNASRRRQI